MTNIYTKCASLCIHFKVRVLSVIGLASWHERIRTPSHALDLHAKLQHPMVKSAGAKGWGSFWGQADCPGCSLKYYFRSVKTYIHPDLFLSLNIMTGTAK